MDVSRLPAEEVPCARVPELLRRARAAQPGPDASKLRRAVALSDLSGAYLASYRCTGEHPDWEASVAAGREARELVPEGRPERRRLTANLANCLSYGRTVAAQEETVRLWRDVLDGLREGSTAHAEALGSSGLAFLALHEMRTDPTDLEHAVTHLDAALTGPRLPESVHAVLTMGLGCALMERCRRRSADPEDAARAVRLLEGLVGTAAVRAVVGFEQALRTNLEAARQESFRVRAESDPGALDRMPEPEAGPGPLPGLGGAGHQDQLSATRAAVSAAVTGRLHEGDRAVALADRALKGVPPHSPSRAPLLCDAAHGRLGRAHRYRRADPDRANEDVLAALALAREATGVAVGVHVAGARTLLAECLIHRYLEIAPRDPRDLDEAVRLLESVLRSPDRRPDILPTARDDYADALLLRAARNSSHEDFAKALELRTEASRRLPRGTVRRARADASLAQVLLIRADGTGLSDHWAEATACARRTVRALEQVMPYAALGSARIWAHWTWKSRRVREAAEALDWTLRLLYRVTVTQITRDDKETVLAEASAAGRRAAHAHAAVGAPGPAALALETVRAVTLAEALDRDRLALDRLRTVRPELADRYTRAAERLARAAETYDGT
ncbi:hypothetical protein [Streptomyces sp. NPDC001480]|uniref:hypothetical protein n=1 Tax=Streptomyces sp. NPDC001480 TaxID=3364577 RepID=UPI0036CFDBBC